MIKSSVRFFIFLPFVGLIGLCLSDETDGTEGSIGKSLWAAGVESRLRSRKAIEPGKLELRSISSARIRRFIELEKINRYLGISQKK